MLELLWQLGILSVVLVFGVKIGLATGFAGLSKKAAAATAAGYGAGIYILTFLISGHVDIVYKVVYEYNFAIFTAMALVIIYAGFSTIREWKVHRKNHAKASCAAMIAPCPCCFGAVLAAIVFASPFIGVSTAFIGQYAAVFMSITIFAFYFASDAVVRITKQPYPILLGNFMLFVGFYFLVSAIVIPNISKVLQSPMSPMEVLSMETLVYVLVFVIILLFTGFYITKKKSSLIR